MASRISGSARTFTVSYEGTSLFRISTTWAEKPHCGKWRDPFMKRTTFLVVTSSRIVASALDMTAP